jgi:hypothetical protein
MAIAGLGLVGAGAWLEASLMGRGLSPLGYGGICSHQALAAVHCAGCYAAVAAVAAGLVLAFVPVPAPALARAGRAPSQR